MRQLYARPVQVRRNPAPVMLALAAWWLVAGAATAPADERTVIGRSALGRPIVAMLDGDPERARIRVLVVGCIHGDETAGIRVARRLVAAAPAPGAALWVVPSLNPDGVAAGTRGNARGVDLNRNFPFRWQPLGGLEYSGPNPLSEPESTAAVGLIRRIGPDITIWFHQPFGLVDLSGGDSAVERRYAQLVGLPAIRLPRYPGSVSTWQNHTITGSTAFVTELPSTVGGPLAGRAAGSVLALAREYADIGVGPATRPGRAE
jgi:protein MpaA